MRVCLTVEEGLKIYQELHKVTSSVIKETLKSMVKINICVENRRVPTGKL